MDEGRRVEVQGVDEGRRVEVQVVQVQVQVQLNLMINIQWIIVNEFLFWKKDNLPVDEGRRVEVQGGPSPSPKLKTDED